MTIKVGITIVLVIAFFYLLWTARSFIGSFLFPNLVTSRGNEEQQTARDQPPPPNQYDY